MKIRPLDLTDTDELRSWYDVTVASTRAVWPGFVPQPFHEQVIGVIDPEVGAESHLHVACDGGRNEIIAPSHVPADRIADHPYRRLAESVGFALSTTATARDLPWPVDATSLDAVAVAPDGYRIETYVDGVPDAYRASLGQLKGLLDVDAPSGDIEWEASSVSLEQHHAEQLRRAVKAGRRLVESVAVTTSGEVVAYTEIDVPSITERPLRQEGTLVRTDHRGHRLGLAVKVANLRRCLELGLPNPAGRTESDDANTHMVAINEALGFVPTHAELILVKRR